MTYDKLAKYFEEKLKRDLKDEEIEFNIWMIKNLKQKGSA